MNTTKEKECNKCKRPVFRSFYHTQNDEEWLTLPILCIGCATQAWVDAKQ